MKLICKTTIVLSLFLFLILTSFTVSVFAQDQGASLFPPNAEPGKCYAKVLVPASFKTVSEEIVKREAAEKIETVPAEFEWVEKKVLVKEATEKIEVIPAVYETVEEKIEIVPASFKLETTKPVYETVDVKVIDKPARTAWKKGSGLLDKIDHATGDIMCLVNIPATYKTIKKQVLKTPATVKKVEVPAQYKTYKRQVVKKPAEVKKVTIPAEYKTIKVKKLVTPAKEVRIPIPEERQVVKKRIKESDEKMSWQPVLCETNMTPDVIKKIQAALADKGFEPGPVDGALGSGTLKALKEFQQKNGLATGGLTYESLKALAVME
ncbi:MAG: hypothetical protein DSY90_07445 [Deltaproteobacteria bacterium]|nr:MAG: hypothetical protein DSY90_07445 [Deltaproteobacteria bacterium]